MNFLDQTRLLMRMAFRTARRQARRSIVVATTGAVGMFSVVLSQGFVNAMQDSLISVAINSGLGHAQIRPAGFLDNRQVGTPLDRAAELEKAFQGRLPPEVTYAPRLEREAILRIGGEVSGVRLMGVEPGREQNVSEIPDWIEAGSFFEADGDEKENHAGETGARSEYRRWSCLLGRINTQELEVDLGDYIVLSTGAKGGGVQSFRCDITGIFRSPTPGLDRYLVIMERDELSRVRSGGNPDEVSYFVFRGKDLEQESFIKSSLVALLDSPGGESDDGAVAGESPDAGFEIATLSEMEPSISNLLELYDQITVFFYFIIMAGFGIVLFEAVTMSIFERMHEIGIMHALGTKPRFLFWMVVFEAFVLMVAGTLAGMLLGNICVWSLYVTGVDFGELTISDQDMTGGLGVVRPYLVLADYVSGFLIAAAISFLSGLYPARRAVAVEPVRAIYNR